MIDLTEWIERLNAADKKNRPVIVEELSKALGVTVEEAWKKLQEAGWNSKKDKPSDGAKNDDSGDKTSEEKQTITLRHKTPHPRYRRAGLVLTGEFKPYEVTAEQLDVLKNDAWVEIKKG